jgi:predicted metalloprotease
MNVAMKIAAALAVGLFTAAPVQAEPVTPQEANADFVVAVQATDGYWRTHWSDFFTLTYTSPRVVGLYDSNVTSLTCAGRTVPSNNALYCGAEHYVAFDLTLMNQVFTLGDSFLYLVVAHEWGHAIQAHLDSSFLFQAYELQADCFAGAAMAGATADGMIAWDADDMQELSNTLIMVADDYPWTDVSDHGSPQERIGNFVTGAKGGPLACIPSGWS